MVAAPSLHGLDLLSSSFSPLFASTPSSGNSGLKQNDSAIQSSNSPQQMTTRGFFRDRLMWAGFILAGGMDLINGLHFLFPIIPGLGGEFFDLRPFFTTKPWNAIGWTPNRYLSLRHWDGIFYPARSLLYLLVLLCVLEVRDDYGQRFRSSAYPRFSFYL